MKKSLVVSLFLAYCCGLLSAPSLFAKEDIDALMEKDYQKDHKKLFKKILEIKIDMLRKPIKRTFDDNETNTYIDNILKGDSIVENNLFLNPSTENFDRRKKILEEFSESYIEKVKNRYLAKQNEGLKERFKKNKDEDDFDLIPCILS